MDSVSSDGVEMENDEAEPAPAGASIRVVAKRTGIPADTLRIWERRYGYPRPPRRAGGSRVYSEEDVARLRLISQALAAGFRPGEAVPLAMSELARLVAASAADGVKAGSAASPEPVGFGVDAVISAVLADDVPRVRSVLRAAALSLGPRTFVTALAYPLSVRIGELWAQGEIDVRHEHLVTACLSAQLQVLLATLDDGARAPVVLLATLPGEDHVLALELIAVYLAASLAAPRLLGTHAPPDQIAASARALGADVVGISVSAAADHARVSAGVDELLGHLPDGVPLWVGGAGARMLADGARSRGRMIATFEDLDLALEEARAARRR